MKVVNLLLLFFLASLFDVRKSDAGSMPHGAIVDWHQYLNSVRHKGKYRGHTYSNLNCHV